MEPSWIDQAAVIHYFGHRPTLQSPNTNDETAEMTYDEKDLDATIIILGLGYVALFLVTIGWVATL